MALSVESAASLTSEKELLAALDRSLTEYVEALRNIARTGSFPEIRQAAIDRLVVCNGCEESLIARPGVSAHAAGSFTRSLLTWSAKSQFAKPTLGLDKAIELVAGNKQHGHRLAEMLGATIPERVGPMSAGEAIDTVSKASSPILIKPLRGPGSIGVFVVHSQDAVLDLRLTEWIGGLEALPGRMAATQRSDWLVEQYLPKSGNPFCPAPDLKFFCFYGQIGLVLEVERFPVRRYAWWTPEGERSPVKMYEGEFFDGGGFTPEHASIVETISAKLPFPFMRIDFLNSGNKLYFGEFTPRPGGFEKYDAETDRMMGRLYLEAELRLVNDLLFGKEFAEFVRWSAPFFPSR